MRIRSNKIFNSQVAYLVDVNLIHYLHSRSLVGSFVFSTMGVVLTLFNGESVVLSYRLYFDIFVYIHIMECGKSACPP